MDKPYKILGKFGEQATVVINSYDTVDQANAALKTYIAIMPGWNLWTSSLPRDR